MTILGDTRVCERAQQLAHNADVLVHESTFAADENELAHSFHHATSEQAAQTAKDAQAKRLILTHISARYHGEGETQLLSEARRIFPETAMAKDHARFEIVRRQTESLEEQ